MRQQAQRRWRTLASSASLPSDLAGPTAVIVGWGSIGRLIAEFLMALGMQIIVARHNPEIGRASCRERVRAYVTSSAVAVPFKKNHTSPSTAHLHTNPTSPP